LKLGEDGLLLAGMSLKVQGIANAALGVDAHGEIAGAPPVGVPLNGSQSTGLLKY
jgi:hypothetical protein